MPVGQRLQGWAGRNHSSQVHAQLSRGPQLGAWSLSPYSGCDPGGWACSADAPFPTAGLDGENKATTAFFCNTVHSLTIWHRINLL